MKKLTLLAAIVLIAPLVALSIAPDTQKANRVKIIVKEEGSHERIPFASICILEKGKVVAVYQTDNDGACFLPVEEKKRTIKITCVGFTPLEMTLEKGGGDVAVHLKGGIMLTTCIIEAPRISSVGYRCCCCCRIRSTECYFTSSGSEEKKSESTTDIQSNDFAIYPNPSTGIIRIKSTFSNFSMEVFDISGRLVFTAKEMNDENEQNLDFLKPETYIVRVSSGELEKTSRLVIG